VDVVCPICKTGKQIQTVAGIIHAPSRAQRRSALARRLRLPDDLQMEAFIEARLPAPYKAPISLTGSQRVIIEVARLLAFSDRGIRLFRKIRDWVQRSSPAYQALRKLVDIKLWTIRSRHNDLYYCYRHDVVFVPGEAKSRKPERKLEILYQP
jgi:hypothetical protein